MSWKAFQNYNKLIIVLVWVLIIVYYYDCTATACAQDAVKDRVTVVLQSGEAVRVALPFAPAGPLPKLALDALHQVLPTGLFHSLATKHLLSPGDATRQLVCMFFHVTFVLFGDHVFTVLQGSVLYVAWIICRWLSLLSCFLSDHCCFASSAIISRWTWCCKLFLALKCCWCCNTVTHKTNKKR